MGGREKPLRSPKLDMCTWVIVPAPLTPGPGAAALEHRFARDAHISMDSDPFRSWDEPFTVHPISRTVHLIVFWFCVNPGSVPRNVIRTLSRYFPSLNPSEDVKLNLSMHSYKAYNHFLPYTIYLRGHSLTATREMQRVDAASVSLSEHPTIHQESHTMSCRINTQSKHAR